MSYSHDEILTILKGSQRILNMYRTEVIADILGRNTGPTDFHRHCDNYLRMKQVTDTLYEELQP